MSPLNNLLPYAIQYLLISDHYQEILSLIFKVIIFTIIQEQYALFRGRMLNQNRPCTEDAKTMEKERESHKESNDGLSNKTFQSQLQHVPN